VDGSEARSELWRRYDAGTIDADELEARLRMVDQAALGDADEVRRAVDGSVPIRRRRSTRKAVVLTLAILGVVAIAGSVVTVAAGDDGDTVSVGPGAVVTFAPVPAVLPEPPPPDCDEFTALLEENGGQFGIPDLPANPVLLTDPPYLPPGYERTSEDDIVPGTDPDIAMATAAGNPLPIEIVGRSIAGGEFPVRMRAFVFDSVETAQQNSRDLARSGLCNFDGERFAIDERPELFGTVVTGVIPTTAFVSFTLGDRRVIVAAEAGDGDLEVAKALAVEIAGAELESARTAPPPG
jgi:hypothetical protein